MSKAKDILDFYHGLSFDHSVLDPDLAVLNPFEGASEEQENVLSAFYHKYYNDASPRDLILGINPGRLGAGATGIPFTDTKRLVGDCGIPFEQFSTHEPSSVFVYQAIAAYGGPQAFYKNFFIGSVCPLGFTVNKNGSEVNFNYYDRASFANKLAPYLLEQIKMQQAIAGNLDRIIVFGKGKNLAFLNKLNKVHQFTGEIIPLEHPRYVMQYKFKQRDQYVDKYLRVFAGEQA